MSTGKLPGAAGETPDQASSPSTYFGTYHGTHEPPFCAARARALFDTVK